MAAVAGITKQSKAMKPNHDLVDTAATDISLQLDVFLTVHHELTIY